MKKVLIICISILVALPLVSLGAIGILIKMKDKPSSEGNSYNSNIDFTSLTYVAFGDSITYGIDALLDYARMDDPYPGLVAEKLGLTAINKGVSGATFCQNNKGRPVMTSQILEFSGEADIISVLLGVNDYVCALPLGTISDEGRDTIYGCLNTIARYLRTNYKDSFVFFMTPYKANHSSTAPYALSAVARAVKEVATLYHFPVLDLYNDGNFELEMYQSYSDGVHPSQAFIRQYTAPQIAEFIRQNYK